MRRTIIHHRTKIPINRRFRLFNRYLFVSLPADFEPHIGSVRACKGVADVLGIEIDGKPCEVARTVVRRFMLAQRRGEFDDIVPFTRRQLMVKLPLGTRIKVRHEHAVFGGFHGMVTRIKGRGVITAALEIFGRMTPVDLLTRNLQAA
jgi:transcription antitermination factor NusG